MSSPTDEEVHRYMEEIVRGVKGIKNRLEKDVRATVAQWGGGGGGGWSMVA